MKILGIESSCDETACAVVEDGRKVLSNIVATSLEEHKLYGGVVPEIASRRHAESISGVVREALEKANCTMDDIDAVAVTYCLWVSTLQKGWLLQAVLRLFRFII